MEEGTPRGFVDASTLDAHEAVLDHVDAAHTVLGTDLVEVDEERQRVALLVAVLEVSDAGGQGVLKLDGDTRDRVGGLSGVDTDREDPLVGRGARVLEDTRLVGAVHQVLVGGEGLVERDGDLDALGLSEADEVAAAGEAIEEGRVLPGCDDPQVGGERREREFEAHLVVALAGGAVGDEGGALGAGDLDLSACDDRARQGRAEEVAPFVDGVAGDGREDELGDEVALEVDDVDGVGTGGERPAPDLVEVLVLAHVGHVGDDAVALEDEPLEDHGGIEASTVGEYDGVLGHGRAVYQPGPPRVEAAAVAVASRRAGERGPQVPRGPVPPGDALPSAERMRPAVDALARA